MSKFGIFSKENTNLIFELSLPKEEKVSRTNVMYLLLKSIIALCFPGEDKYHKSYPLLSLKETENLRRNNPFLKIFNDLEGYEFNYTDLEMVSINTFLIHKFVDNVVIDVSKIKNLPVTKDEELIDDVHFKGLYKAGLTSKKWIDFLPEGFLLEVDYMYYHDPGENGQDDNFNNFYNI